MKVAMLPRSPERRRWNPYLDLLEVGLRQNGIETVDDPHDDLSWRWLLRHHGLVDVLHFHWLQYHYDRGTATQSAISLTKFTIKLMLARSLGYRLVWTVHNLRPHELRYSRLDRCCRLVLYTLAHAIIAHCEEARRQLEVLFGRRQNVYAIPLPNYMGVYPELPDREAARQQLGLDKPNLVFLCFGAVRPYKGLQDAIAAFKKLPDGNARLIIAGWPLNERIAQEISTLANDDDRILSVLSFIPDSDVPTYFSAADVVVLPFRKITTSSSAILAMSLARPVVAPTLGCLPELVTEGTGVLYDPRDPAALVEAMGHCRELNLTAMGRLAYQRVVQFTPDRVASQHLEVYAA